MSYAPDRQLLTISRQPQPLTVESGETAAFSVEVKGQPQGLVTFTWKRNGDPVASAANSPFLELANVSLAHTGYYSVTITDSAEALESEVALLRVTSSSRHAAWDLGRKVLLWLAAASLLLAGYLWIEPTTSCSVTVERAARSSGTTFTQRAVGRSDGRGRTTSRERTRELRRETRSSPVTSAAASTERCSVPANTAGTVTVVESRDPTDGKEVVVALVGLAAALGLVAALYSRVAKVSFPGGSLELRELAQKTTQAVGSASTNLEALSAALAVVKSGAEKAQKDLEDERTFRSLSVEKLELRIAKLEAEKRPPTVAE
jgi:hypothetical protein